jgi:oxygen-independent coproporphyrinogen-3 oxidase
MVEMELVAERTPHRRTYSQLHLGGGTPTYFAPDQLDRLLETFRGHFRPADISESSVEVDPRVTTHAHLEVFAKWGFERLSVGVQDFNADVQRAVNRVQSYAITDEIIQAGRKLGMESINVDVIYGLPGQTPEGFAETLKQVIDLGADRLAVYGFAYLPTLKGNQRSMTSDMLPSRDVRFELQAVGRRTLCDAGYVDIGMDHFALPKDPLTTAQQAGRLHRNFMGYTTDTADTMLGFGISSIGFVDGSYIQNERKLSRYRESIRAGRLPIERGLVTTVDDRIRARVIQEMMCNFVIHPSQIADRFGIDFEAYFETELDEMRELAEVGMIRIGEDRIEATTLGRSFVRNLALPFDAYLRSGDTSLYSQTV